MIHADIFIYWVTVFLAAFAIYNYILTRLQLVQLTQLPLPNHNSLHNYVCGSQASSKFYMVLFNIKVGCEILL